MTRAIRNMMVQQCWAGSFKGVLSVVEPFSSESQLIHTPRIWDDLMRGQLYNAARFSDYYNLTFYNAQIARSGGAKLVKWESFLENAPRTAVAVAIPTHRCRNGAMMQSNCSYSKIYQSFLDTLSVIGFNIVKRVCFTCSPTGPPHKFGNFSDLFFDGNHSEVSIFVNTWRNFGFTNAWMEIPGYCKLAENPNTSNNLIPSALVIQHTNHYISNFIQNEHFIGIMLRIERFLVMAASGRSNDSVKSCLSKAALMFDENISQKNVGVYVTVDIGKYGSTVMQEEMVVSRFGLGSIEFITDLVESLFTHIFNATVTLENWEETFVNATGGIKERGYIAIVQRNIASQADCLILMGGGSFLQIAGFQYLKHSKHCLRTVCVLNSFNKVFNITNNK